MDQSTQLKQQVAQAALAFLPKNGIIGMGTGSTISQLIPLLKKIPTQNLTFVASSITTQKQLTEYGFTCIPFNEATNLDLYIDGADEINTQGICIKGGGGALTREKILAQAAKNFLCLIDESKMVQTLGQKHALPIEVLQFARTAVAKQCILLKGRPQYREHFVTDNGHIILDVYFKITDLKALNDHLNQIPGVVAHGLFLTQKADTILMSGPQGIQRFDP